jgi:xanthine/uracil permease
VKLFDVLANIVAGFVIWVMLTGLVYFFVSWGSDEAPGKVPFWPWKAVIIAVSVLSFSLYTRRYWKKLDR